MLIATVFTYLLNFFYHSDAAYKVHMRVAVGLLLALWLRIMKYARPFRQTGPFVIILGHITADFLKWAVLFFIIYIPYSASFWMVFGGVSPTPVKGYGTVSELLFNVFRMTVVDQYNFRGLAEKDAIMAKLLCGTYIALSAVIILNILIALLSHTFQRVYDNAKSNAVMLRAKVVLNLERSLSRKRRRKLYDYVIAHCSPEVLPYEDECWENELSFQATNKNILAEVEEIHHLVHGSLGKRCGLKAKSDFDSVMDNVVTFRKSQQDLQEASLRIKVHLTKLENFFRELDSPCNKSRASSIQPSLKSCKGGGSQELHARSLRMLDGVTPAWSPRMIRQSSRVSGGSSHCSSGASKRGPRPSVCRTRDSFRRSSRGTRSESCRSPKENLGQRLSVPMRRKYGVASLQHDPEMYTSHMMKQAAVTPSLKGFAEHGLPESSDSITARQPSNNAETRTSGKDTPNLIWDDYNNTLANSEDSRGSLAASSRCKEAMATESGATDSDRCMTDDNPPKSKLARQSSVEAKGFAKGITNFGLILDDDQSLRRTLDAKEKQS